MLCYNSLFNCEGIGRETAIALSATNKWKLVLTARSQAGLEGTARSCPGPTPYLVAGDITDEQQVVNVFVAAKREYGMCLNSLSKGAVEI